MIVAVGISKCAGRTSALGQNGDLGFEAATELKSERSNDG